MKKFITTIPVTQKPDFLRDLTYEAFNNEHFVNDLKTCFPVLPLIKGYIEKNEEIEIIAIRTVDEACFDEDTNLNLSEVHFERFKQQAKECLKGINYKINEIIIKFDESVEAHLNTCVKLIEQIQEGDIIFADLTFGTKPIPIIEMMALNYALRVMDDVVVECLSYGSYNHNKKDPHCFIYDVTSLLYMDEIINNISKNNVENPIDIIKSILE